MRLLPALATAVLAFTLAPAAHAQSSANSTGWMSSLGSSNGELSSGLTQGLSSGNLSSTGSSLPETHQEFSRNYGSSLAAIDTTFGILGLLGDNSTILTDLWKSEQDIYPFPIDESITTAELISRTAHNQPGIERWIVASPSMGRNVEVEVLVGNGGPMVYMLEGIGATKNSNWFREGYAQDVFEGTNATIVIPTQAAGSMWQDWDNDDPKLGRYKWDTFVTEELAPIVEDEVSHNSKRGLIGLSMGASGAVMMANNNPGFFDGVAGISGCYSTTDSIGSGTIKLTVGNQGGDPNNMWSTQEAWERNDVVLNPEGLRGTQIYLSAANGEITDEEREFYADREITDQIAGSLLEAGSLKCTENLSDSLTKAGIEHTPHYLGAGAHSWIMFGPQLQPAWDGIKSALY
ncbi:alpha/beta hydrolase [Corynebacterium casei]|uniref:Esterase n=1 Tax=Corynebacterium casei LMG S-19264 TaxID=1285583 RepID=A0ABN4CD02_9CORY|nr:alpha/beta hydrolase family protein [Corynebacterium casei]AHI20205.1 esterase [Corynebacterium casei LMG S-19264]